MIFPFAAFLVLFAAPSVVGWGQKVHEIIGLIAQEFLSQEGQAFLYHTLKQHETLSSVSGWADKIKDDPKYKNTSPMHYVKAQHDPISNCDFIEDRDCHDGKCIVGAIARYTEQAMDRATSSDAQRYEAVKFLAHFLGDITQPLHVTSHCNGGNSVYIKYKKKSRYVNLHKAWDTLMPDHRIKDDFGRSPEIYAEFLVDSIRRGKFRKYAPLWLSKHGLTDLSRNGNSLAGIDWATESGALNCGVVWPDYYANPNQDFSGKYYKKVVPVLDCQIAKAGYRLADWINRISDSN